MDLFCSILFKFAPKSYIIIKKCVSLHLQYNESTLLCNVYFSLL